MLWWKEGIFVSLFGEYLIKFVFFFCLVLHFGRGSFGVENSHSQAESQALILFLLPWCYIVQEVIFFYSMYDVLLKALLFLWIPYFELLLNLTHFGIVG